MKFIADIPSEARACQPSSEALVEADNGPIVIRFGNVEKFVGFPTDRESVLRRAKYSHAEIDEIDEA